LREFLTRSHELRLRLDHSPAKGGEEEVGWDVANNVEWEPVAADMEVTEVGCCREGMNWRVVVSL
jgi:hypothetical protein